MENKKSAIQYYLLGLIIGVVVSILLSFVFVVNSFSQRFLIIISGAICFALVFGSFLFFHNKIIRPKIFNYYLHHKSLKSLDSLGLLYNEKMKCYYGNLRGFDIQVSCHYDNYTIFETEYVISIIFKKMTPDMIEKFDISDMYRNINLAEYFIQQINVFKFFPPKMKKMVRDINFLLDYLTENKFEPIRLEALEKELNKNMA